MIYHLLQQEFQIYINKHQTIMLDKSKLINRNSLIIGIKHSRNRLNRYFSNTFRVNNSSSIVKINLMRVFYIIFKCEQSG